MLGWRWESPERGQRQPLFGCRRQRDKTLNKVSNSSMSQKQAKYAPSTIKHLLGCRPTRQQAVRLQIFKHAQKSRCIAATAFIISINPHSTVELTTH